MLIHSPKTSNSTKGSLNAERVTLAEWFPTISIFGRPLCNLRFADDIDLIAGSQAELQVLTDRLVASSKAFGMEVSSEKSKVMVSSERVNEASITMDDEPLELVHKFRYLGATLHEDGQSGPLLVGSVSV
ncbi:endonuclease-reverse transcriptase [Elysia marginata]|uniref:Endonuclease-reverse transcriptase n=1 Tax=Elysia marginata TaxID=1093978 RepID=A0AAV4G941_9GAST|nr:endonuclease-reverse transcriptase [Elysia marginata]